MDSKQILDMITANRGYIRLKSNIALQNLAMLHKSFDSVEDEECRLSLALNDSLVEVIFSADYTAAIDISLRTLDRYQGSKHIALLAEFEELIGRCYTFLTEYDTGFVHLRRAEELVFGQLPDSEEALALRADILHNLAMNNHHAGWGEDKTTEYLNQALDILEGTDFTNRKGICLMGLGNVNMVADRMEEALAYHLQAKVLFEEIENHGNLSTVYSNIGICYTHLGQFDSAQDYIMRALDMRTRMGSYWEIANSYFTLATLYIKKGDLDAGYDNLLISRDYALVSQVKGGQQLVLKELEALCLLRGDIAGAEEHRMQLTEIETVAV
jgi:tetratricopeptide (TPR) repeat protein